MTIAAGYFCTFYYKEEAGAYGTIANSGIWQQLGPVKSVPISVSIPRANIAGLNSRVRVFKPVLNHEADVSVDVPLQMDTNWVLLKDIDDATLKLYSLAALINFPTGTDYWIYWPGAYLDSAEVKWATNEVTNIKLNWNVQQLDGPYTSDQYGGSSYEAVSTAVPRVWKDGKFNVNAGFSNTGDKDDVQSFTVTIKNNYEKKHGWTNAYARDSQEKGFDINGSVTKLFENLDQLTEMIAEETGTLRLYVDSANYIQLTGVTWDEWSSDLTELELLDYDIPFTADNCTFV